MHILLTFERLKILIWHFYAKHKNHLKQILVYNSSKYLFFWFNIFFYFRHLHQFFKNTIAIAIWQVCVRWAKGKTWDTWLSPVRGRRFWRCLWTWILWSSASSEHSKKSLSLFSSVTRCCSVVCSSPGGPPISWWANKAFVKENFKIWGLIWSIKVSVGFKASAQSAKQQSTCVYDDCFLIWLWQDSMDFINESKEDLNGNSEETDFCQASLHSMWLSTFCSYVQFHICTLWHS